MSDIDTLVGNNGFIFMWVIGCNCCFQPAGVIAFGEFWFEVRPAEFIAQQRPFGDHLRRYLWLIGDQSDLRDALIQVISHKWCTDQASYYRLLRAGLIKGPEKGACRCRCRLYEEYLKDKL